MRKTTLGLRMCLVSMAAVLLASCSSTTTPHASSSTVPLSGPTLRVGYFASLAGGAVPAIGSHFGWFSQVGLRVDFIPFTAAPALSAALVGGSIDMSSVGMNAAIDNLSPYAKIVALDDYDNDDYLLAAPSSGITSISQLRGKTVGYIQGTNAQIVLQLALDSAHLTLSEINAVNLQPPAVVSAFLGHQIQAASIYLPFAASITSASPGTRVLARASTYLGPSAIPLVWIASDRALQTERTQVKKFLEVVAKVRNFRAAHLKQSAQIVYQFTNSPSEAPFLEQMTAEGWPTSAEVLKFYDSGGMVTSWRNIQAVLSQAGIIKQPLPASAVMDLSLDTAVLKSAT
jgi:ABC-type nitrate/sulfonate/bicarbonate transport system substrate-binding protein